MGAGFSQNRNFCSSRFMGQYLLRDGVDGTADGAEQLVMRSHAGSTQQVSTPWHHHQQQHHPQGDGTEFNRLWEHGSVLSFTGT